MSLPKTAYELAREKFRSLDRRLTRVATKRPSAVRQSLAIRLAADVAYQQAPISIMAPRPDDASTIHRFVIDQFREAQARKKAISR